MSNKQQSGEQAQSTAFRDIGEGIGRGLAEGLKPWPELKPEPEPTPRPMTGAITINVDPQLNAAGLDRIFTALGEARQMQRAM